MSAEIQSLLEHHWALDSLAAEAFANSLPPAGEDHIYAIADSLNPIAVIARDMHRLEQKELTAGRIDKMWFTGGPCSTDMDVPYAPLHALRMELVEQHPDWIIDERLNGDKPRTSFGWRGLLNSTNPEERRRAFEIMEEAFILGIPIWSEVTDPWHLGSIAPYSTGVWLGARDIGSSLLRGALSAVPGMCVAGKNGTDGLAKTVGNAMLAIGSTTLDNEGSGINLGTIGGTAHHPGYPTGILPVGQGNQHVSIIARGYELPTGLTEQERDGAAYDNISSMCELATVRGTVLRLDLNHGSPKMFTVDVSCPDRSLKVIQKIGKGIISGRIKNADRIRGLLCEIGPVRGRTDPNELIDSGTAHRIGEIMMTLSDAIKVAA